MKKSNAILLIALFLVATGGSEKSWKIRAQTYDAKSGTSPLVLLEVPKDGLAYYDAKVKAREYRKSEKFAELEPLAERLARDYPRDPENWMLLGEARWGLKKYAESILAFEKAGPLIGWDLEFGNGYRMAAGHMRAGDKTAALKMLRHMIFERRGFHRADLYDWPSFEPLKKDREFLELIGRPDASRWKRTEGWTFDIELLYSELKRVNPDYRDKPFPSEMTRRYEDLKRNISKLSDEEIFVEMNRFLAPLHQGHVAIWSPSFNRHLPLRLYVFPDGIYIIEGRDGNEDLYASRVISFGSLPAEEALRRLAEASTVDGDMQHVWGVSRLTETSWLKGLGGTDSAEKVTIIVQPASGQARTVILTTNPKEPADRQDRMIAPKAITPPLYLSNMTQKHWEVSLPEQDALFVQVNNLADEKEETLAAFGVRLWNVLQKQRPKNMILDLRHNNGGTTQLYPDLLRTIIAYSRGEGNQIYVLIGRRSYSATGNFVTDLERLADPIFVGEATSECCNLYGDPAAVVLPYSKTQAELTAVKWNLSTPSDRRREISPEVPVHLTAKDYFAGKDPALELIYKIIADRGKI